MHTRAPTDDDVAVLLQTALGEPPLTLRRFPTGLAHYVYDVVTESGRNVVVRMALPEHQGNLAGGVYWSERLRPIGVPLPTIPYHDLDASITPFPSLILERLPGTDLGEVYSGLTVDEKRRLADEVVRIQHLVGTLPMGNGFGYVESYEKGFPCRTWSELVHGVLARSRSQILRIGIFDPHHADRVEAALVLFEGYFDRMQPRAFLDDITTKNVIVHDGQLSGIVDVDEVCFGDSLFTVALTRMSLINLGYDLDYISFWCDCLKLSAIENAVLNLYTCVFCVVFMSEIGQSFNKERPEPIDRQRIQRLVDILDSLLSE